MNWFFISLQWYLVITLVGLIFYPLTKRLFKSFPLDYGYSFSKVIGILTISYITLILGIFKIAPFTQLMLWILVGLFLIINSIVWKHDSKKSLASPFTANTLWAIFLQELLFFVAFIFWTVVRGQEPSIHGLEKFMDFGFMNSILRSIYFPPLDMWYSADPSQPQGYPINYYYFGHLTGAVLIKLTGVKSSIGYNLILSTIFALSITQTFSLIANILQHSFASIKDIVFNRRMLLHIALFALFGTYILNLGGNLHTIYLFTNGYPNDKPVPFWQILSSYTPEKYWYPNATRFIPFTIHEFPSYSYVVADLHGHVFDIPFVLLTVAILYIFFTTYFNHDKNNKKSHTHTTVKHNKYESTTFIEKFINFFETHASLMYVIGLGALCAIHYMTNAFDGPIYLLFSLAVLFSIYFVTAQFFIRAGILVLSFIIFALPFSVHFSPFVSGIGVNCSPDFLVKIGKIGPFLFEKGNCQASPFWMLGILWGFFWIHFIVFVFVIFKELKQHELISKKHVIDFFVLMLFVLGTILTIVPEFFYMKDIYPAHFRANTMFKLGYQAFILMSIASTYTLWRFKGISLFLPAKFLIQGILLFIIFLVSIYPLFSVPSYYGKLDRPVVLDGAEWLNTSYPHDKEVIDFLNNNIKGQPVVLEAQGDSYTDYERISAYTGLPTIAGWWVHQWLWRGNSDVVGKRIPDIVNIYESADITQTKELLRKYNVSYVLVSNLEREKYPQLKEEKFRQVGKEVFKSQDKKAILYQVK